jgi:hypothetical protein
MSEQDSSVHSQRLLEALARCNRSELYQLCRKAGYGPTPNNTRTELIQLFLNNIEPSQDGNPIDLWRQGLKGFVTERWAVLQPQLTCPIRHDINACTGCLDTQVIACVVEQRHYEQLIQLHRKKA